MWCWFFGHPAHYLLSNCVVQLESTAIILGRNVRPRACHALAEHAPNTHQPGNQVLLPPGTRLTLLACLVPITMRCVRATTQHVLVPIAAAFAKTAEGPHKGARPCFAAFASTGAVCFEAPTGC